MGIFRSLYTLLNPPGRHFISTSKEEQKFALKYYGIRAYELLIEHGAEGEPFWLSPYNIHHFSPAIAAENAIRRNRKLAELEKE